MGPTFHPMLVLFRKSQTSASGSKQLYTHLKRMKGFFNPGKLALIVIYLAA